MEISPKGSLPYGWSVHFSKKYRNKLYYFNSTTGDTTWECPKLDPPRVLSEDKDKEAADMYRKNTRKDSITNKSFETSSEIRDDNIEKSAIPPTAVVAPVVHKSRKGNSPIQPSEKRVQFKRKRDSLSEDSNENKISCERTPEKMKKKKHVSPLNKSPAKEASNELIDGTQSPSVEKMSEDEMCNSTILEPENESFINDVEMRDVSVELLNDLTEKKETVFDTTACYYIVVDTNILIGELDLINELKDTPLDGCGPPHIFIPWIVIEELDKLKSQRIPKVSSCASVAIRYLNSVLCKHPRFHGQSPAEAEVWAKAYSKCNDDKILECCMGLSNKMPAEKVILLTNDKNLVNKALICKINVHNFESMIKKVKPDTKFNCEEMKAGRKKKREKEVDVQKNVNESQLAAKKNLEERLLHSKRDKCKCEIHNIMSNARLLLKDILHKFLSEEMLDAYGNIWTKFPIDTKLLKGLLEGILKYWKTVFSAFLSEKDKRNIELLLEKANRPEGFLGDKDECLVILSAVEDLFRQIQARRPKLNVPVELIQEYRLACVNAFIIYCEAESELRLAEDKSVREVLDDNWTAINQLCGIIMDHYDIPHEFDYYANNTKYSDADVQRLMVIIYPAVQRIKRLLCEVFDALKKSQPMKKLTKRLASALLEFIPSLNLPYEPPKTYPFFNTTVLEKWLTSPQNRQKIEIGISQIKTFFSKLEEAFRVMISSPSKKSLEQAI